jgi:hypothetical protein
MMISPSHTFSTTRPPMFGFQSLSLWYSKVLWQLPPVIGCGWVGVELVRGDDDEAAAA